MDMFQVEKKKLVYVASPHGGKQENIEYNGKACRYVRQRGHTPLSPHFALGYLNEETEREIAMQQCKELMLSCDEVWFFIENGRSKGMIEEEQFAREREIKIMVVGGI